MKLTYATYRAIAEAVDRATNPQRAYPNLHADYLWVRTNLEPLVSA